MARREQCGAHSPATVGLSVPTWAAVPTRRSGGPDDELAPVDHDVRSRPGTINVIVVVPVPLTDAALVNAVVTATEAKAQAVLDAGFAGTGTPTDAICIAAPAEPGSAPAEEFTGPRSPWGASIARAVHAAVRDGAVGYAAALAGARPR
jgi:adenosylcobinamide amidohydrolase